MGIKNRIEAEYPYFLTLTVIDWIDVFTRPYYRHILVDSLRYCIENKGLELYGWVVMSNHIHMIAAATENFHLSDILRDFKKFTSKAITQAIQEEPESRKDWMLNRFSFAAANDRKVKDYKFWPEGNEAKEIHTAHFLQQKLDYLHQNPVRAELVDEPHHYRYSSAIDYSGGKGLLPVVLV